MGLSLAASSGLLLAARVGKHTDELIEELLITTEGKTDCKQWNSDNWGGKKRVLPPEIEHYSGKDRTRAIRADERNRQTANRTMASTTEYERLAEEGFPRQLSQIRQTMGADKSDCSIGGELLQLVWAAQSVQDHCCKGGQD